MLQIRPYLISDGGNVELSEIDGPVVYLKLQGACGSCPSSTTTMTMGIRRRLMEKIPVSASSSTAAPGASPPAGHHMHVIWACMHVVCICICMHGLGMCIHMFG